MGGRRVLPYYYPGSHLIVLMQVYEGIHFNRLYSCPHNEYIEISTLLQAIEADFSISIGVTQEEVI